MCSIDNLIGKKFNRLLVISDSGKRKKPKGGVIWECLCDCGKIVYSPGWELKNNKSLSCGCYHKEIMSNLKTQLIDGRTYTSTYRIYLSIKSRCYNPKNNVFKDYGARGINMSIDWLNDFANFYKDMGEKPEGMTIERINNELGYSKENCKWASRKEQANNRRSNVLIELDGKTLNMKQWSEIYGISNKTIHKRIKDGWSYVDAIKTPTRKRKN